MSPQATNLSNAREAWGADFPAWVELLATYADRNGQKAAGAKIGRSGGYVSRVVRRNYTGSYAEAEQLVVARLGDGNVVCPEFGEISRASCLRNRRRTAPPTNFLQRRFSEACPACPLNPDIQEDAR